MTQVKLWAYVSLVFVQTAVFSQERIPVAFDVNLSDRTTITIHWTRPQADSSDYVLEKSVDAKTWQTIAHISSELSPCYDYIDLQLKDGINYYRIATKSEGQLLAVSDTKWIKTTNPDKLYFWPTPANDIVHIRSPFVNGNMAIINSDGRLVRKISIIDFITDVPLQALPSGIYFIQVRHGKDLLVEKFLKQQGF
jgi:hypothetical protein